MRRLSRVLGCGYEITHRDMVRSHPEEPGCFKFVLASRANQRQCLGGAQNVRAFGMRLV